MVVFSNRRLGARAEVLVSPMVAKAMLLETAEAARPLAASRWELELVEWLGQRAEPVASELDVAEFAWTRDHFELQRSFVTTAISVAGTTSMHGPALARWCQLIEAHPAEAVQFGRRWTRVSHLSTS